MTHARAASLNRLLAYMACANIVTHFTNGLERGDEGYYRGA